MYGYNPTDRKWNRFGTDFRVVINEDYDTKKNLTSFETQGLNINSNGLFIADPENKLEMNEFEISIYVKNRLAPAKFIVEKVHKSTYRGIDGWGLKFVKPC